MIIYIIIIEMGITHVLVMIEIKIWGAGGDLDSKLINW